MEKEVIFFIQDYNIVIEVDGGFHHKNNVMNGTTQNETIEIDRWKDEQHLNHNIKTIRIIYDDNKQLDSFKNAIISSSMSDLFNLNNVDWVECHKSGLKNIVKYICGLYKNTDNITPSDIAKSTGLSDTTIRKYLTFGNELGWCVYDVSDIMRDIGAKNGKKGGNSINVYKDGVLLHTLDSCAEVERLSEELFGLKFAHISRYVGNNKEYKGFTFEFAKPTEIKYHKSTKGKAIGIYKHDELLGVFQSSLELERFSYDLFGIKLHSSCISAVAKGNRNTHKGYTFKYVEQNEIKY